MNTINSLLCAIEGWLTETNPTIIYELSDLGLALLTLNVEQLFPAGIGDCSWAGIGMEGDTAVGGTRHRGVLPQLRSQQSTKPKPGRIFYLTAALVL